MRRSARSRSGFSILCVLLAVGIVTPHPAQSTPRKGRYADGHSRPRALVYNPRDRLLYVALSTSDEVAAIDTQAHPARVVLRIATGPFPQALELLPSGDVLVVCRYDAMLGIIESSPQTRPPGERYRRLRAGTLHGLRGVAVHRSGRIFVATPAMSGVQAIDLEGGVVQTVETGLSPRALRIALDPRGSGEELLLVSNFIEHSVDVHALGADGRIGARLQRISTQAPVQDFFVAPLPEPTLLLLSHEDRPVDRSAPFVAGMDSVILALPARTERSASPPFFDPGGGQRATVNLSEGRQPLVKLDALAFDPRTQRLAIVGAATDNLRLVKAPNLANLGGPGMTTLRTGSNPVAAVFLPDGRVATADRLSDTVSLLSPSRPAERVVVGSPSRSGASELGELLFFSRALVPRNIADGERSLYTCSGCHDDGHVDGRLHPARQNRFQSMTKTCRSIGSTAPYLFLGEVADIEGFAANLLSTHAQGAERGPGFDRYSTTLRLWKKRTAEFAPHTLSAMEIRRAMAEYLRAIPPEPSPFLPFLATEMPAEARRGMNIFQRGCASCHRLVADSVQDTLIADADLERQLLRGEVALTSALLYDVGVKVLGQGGNNPPSLRGVWDNAPYFSDGSARTLEEVLQRSTLDGAGRVHAPAPSSPSSPSSPLSSAIDAESRAALLAFLRCL